MDNFNMITHADAYLCSVTRAMWCVRHAVTSLHQLASAMYVALPQAATTGAMPWSVWWSPSASHARTRPMAATPSQPTTTTMATARRVHMHRNAARARNVALLAQQKRSWTTSLVRMAGLPPPRLVGLRGTASASMTASTSSLLTVLTTTIMEALPPPSAAVNTCSSWMWQGSRLAVPSPCTSSVRSHPQKY